MKTNFFFYLLFINFLFQISNLQAETIFFDSKNIKIEENGEMIYAKDGIAKIPSKYLEIEGKKFIYDKKNSELIIFDDAKYIDKKNNITIESQKLIYNDINNTVFSQSETFIEIKNKYKINSSNVFFDRNRKEISSKKLTEVFDNDDNEFLFKKGMLFETLKEIISSRTAFVTDKNNNNYFFENSKVMLSTNEIIGKEIQIDFEDSFFGDINNDPILKGKSVVSNPESTRIYKTSFSTCNMENKRCRGWELQSDIFTHNKLEKLFEYKNSWFKVFDRRVFFLPYFNHPDPSVKRKSGFLTPSYRGNDNLGSSLYIPYFYAVSDSNDFTFKPRIYLDNSYIFQSEYREAFKNSDLILDFSFNRDESTNTHLFAELDGKISDTTDYELKFQKVSNDSYLKVHSIGEDTEIIGSESTLMSGFNFARRIDESTDFTSSFTLYESLSANDHDRFQYIFPDFNFRKKLDLDESYYGEFEFLSSGFQKLYETNKHEVLLNNDFNFNSYDYINSKGIVTDYSLLLKNYNTYAKNSSSYENKNDHDIFSTVLLKSKLPLKKNIGDNTNYLNPILQFRFSPTNGKNISADGSKIGYDNIFSSNRIGRSDMVEKGASLTFGVEFEKQNIENEKLLGINLGTVLKDKKNTSLPSMSKLGQTRSDVVGNLFYKYKDNVELSYNFSFDRDLDYSNYDEINAEFGLNNLLTTFSYITENHDFGDSETLSNETQFIFNNENFLKFETTKDLKDDFTQFYKLLYEYKTDCLSATFKYEKKFFRDGNLVPNQSLYFLIKFIPFVELRGSANTFINSR